MIQTSNVCKSREMGLKYTLHFPYKDKRISILSTSTCLQFMCGSGIRHATCVCFLVEKTKIELHVSYRVAHDMTEIQNDFRVTEVLSYFELNGSSFCHKNLKSLYFCAIYVISIFILVFLSKCKPNGKVIHNLTTLPYQQI